MRNLFSCLLIALLSFGLVINEASAKRFGGGRSFGVQRSQSSLFSSPKAQKTASPGQRSTGNKWGGMLGGLLVGGLLASLFMGHGLGTGIITWLILGAVLFFVVSFIRRRMQPGMQTASSSAFRQNSFNNFTQPFANSSSNNYGNSSEYPAGFTPDNFLRDAKVSFIRLQAAYDQKNLHDLTAFTAPEVFGEIKMQLDERGDAPNKTEVIDLNAELLDVSKQFDSTIASVRFTGTIKENDEPSTQLDEIWHFRQFGNTKEWVVGGIQQEVVRP
ncbi:transporter [Legionella antarctica]|uniref:Transporter n=1 Tax=Legionella antarctica TaxID=2708020 RepID=A0A6F8T1H3_9GAMM|nr:TIM44-like domain-containing protein [Legionella antarctica]BCA94238.1 transporter [Legionella antarctica]